MRARTKALGGTAAALALVTVLLLMPLPRSWEGPWQSKLFDLGHVALFFTLTLFLWLTLNRSWAWALGFSLGLGGLAELVQDYFGRTGSLLDFVRDVLGAATAVVVVRAWQGPRTVLRLAGHALAVVALLAWPVADVAPRLLDAYEGYRDFPTLADFATDGQMIRWECSQATLRRVPDPGQLSGWSVRLELLTGPREYPGAIFQPIVRDWSGRRRLCCSFTVPDRPLLVVISVRGHNGVGSSSTHYDHGKTYPADTHTLRLDLDEIARKAEPGRLDLSGIREMLVFTIRPAGTRTLYLHRIWLE
jgi:hypothetical protein